MTLSMEKWGPGASVRGSDPFLSNCHDHVTASVVRIDIVGDDADSEVPCTAHGASLAAGYVEVVREYEFDAFYPDGALCAGRVTVFIPRGCSFPAQSISVSMMPRAVRLCGQTFLTVRFSSTMRPADSR